MKNYIKKIIFASLIIGGILFGFSKTYGLEDIVNKNKTEIKADSIKKVEIKKKEKTREYKLNTNFLFNEIVRGGSLSIKGEKERYLDDKILGWDDYFTLSYDYTALSNDYCDLLKKERVGKEKRVGIIGWHVSYMGKPFVDLMYSSDGSIGIYSTFLVGGLGKEFSNGFKIEGGIGMKTGKVDFRNETYNVMNLSLGYKTPTQKNKKNDYDLNATFKAYLPRKYITNNSFNGLWKIDAKAALAINKEILGVMPVIGFTLNRDYIPVIENNQLNYAGILRYNLTLGFNIVKGGEIKQ